MSGLRRLGVYEDFLGSIMKKREKEVEPMETKSRYEVIADLEKKKRDLIRERDGFKGEQERKEREIKNTKRELEDLEEDLSNFKADVEDKKETIKELIKGVEQSLDRFSKLQSKK